MSKQLTKSDYLWGLSFLLLLCIAVGAFFYGVKIGKESTERRYEAMHTPEIPVELQSYDQQYLVSFYYTTFIPFRDFEKKWFEQADSWEMGSSDKNASSDFQELAQLAKMKFEEMEVRVFPDHSPMLVEAHQDYLKSLRLFKEAMTQLGSQKLKGSELASALKSSSFLNEAKLYALSGQHKFFTSIFLWNEMFEKGPSTDSIINDPSVADWNNWGLHSKNYAITRMMLDQKLFIPYYPQDVAVNVDHLIRNGQAAQLKLDRLSDLITTIVGTGAVRANDYLMGKEHYYNNETMPLLPFFSDSN